METMNQNNRVTEVEAAGLTWRVYNKTAQIEHATAECLSYRNVGFSLQIGNSLEVLDLSDTDDIESRIITALDAAENQQPKYFFIKPQGYVSGRHFQNCGL
jgi:hypothetical protein